MHPILVLVSSAAIAQEPVQGQWPAAEIGRFELELHTGNVRIRGEQELEHAQVETRAVSWGEGCEVDVGRDAERLWVRTTHEQPLSQTCQLDVALRVAHTTTLALKVAVGTVHVSGVSGPITADVGAGDLVLGGVEGAVDAEMGRGRLLGTFEGSRIRAEIGSGTVQLAELVAPADIEVGMGNVELIYQQAPNGAIAVRSGTGAIRVLLPPGSLVEANLAAGIGSTRVDMPEVDGAATRVHASTGVGRVFVGPSQSSLDD